MKKILGKIMGGNEKNNVEIMEKIMEKIKLK